MRGHLIKPHDAQTNPGEQRDRDHSGTQHLHHVSSGAARSSGIFHHFAESGLRPLDTLPTIVRLVTDRVRRAMIVMPARFLLEPHHHEPEQGGARDGQILNG